MKKTNHSTWLFLAVCFLLCACNRNLSAEEDSTPPLTVTEKEQDEPTVPAMQSGRNFSTQESSASGVSEDFGDDIPVSRALVAKMLAMAYHDLSSIETADREIPFQDTAADDWYDKYINAVYIDGVMRGTGDSFMPDQPVTLSQVQILFDQVDPKNTVKLQLTNENRDKPVSYALWIELLGKFLETQCGEMTLKEVFQIEVNSFVVLAVPESNAYLREWNIITDKGPLLCTGLQLDGYIDREIRVWQKDKEIIAILAVENESPTIRNAYIVAYNADSVTIFSGGAQRRYVYAETPRDAEGKLCDIRIQGEYVQSLSVYEETLCDTVKRTDQTMVEFLNLASIEIGENFKIYSVADGPVKWKTLSDIVIGTDITAFTIKDGKICGAVITRKASPETLWVAIHTTGYQGLYHAEVRLTGTTDFSLSAGSETTTYKAGDIVTVSEEMFQSQNRITAAPLAESGRLRILSIQRNWPEGENPAYRGKLEISRGDKGYVIVNEIAMEEYLYAVVPSEMPSGYGVEVSKAQAVTARSYAYNQLYANRFHSYGANMDDSVSCQVYNNIPENSTSIEAVDATRGQCLTYGGAVIAANFFSTSAGVTANSGEVWPDSVTKQFPASTQTYLRSALQHDGEDYGDLRLEENASRFFRDLDITSYDSQFPWFRWNVEMTAEELTASINAGIADRYRANTPLIKTLQSGNVYRSREIESIGELVDLEVTRRGEGGNVMEMKITGTEATVLVSTEYNVRVLLCPKRLIPDGRDIGTVAGQGREIINYSIMPSGFFVMEKTVDENGKLQTIHFYGGGNGHGVGMSQNGVKGMIDAGKSYDQVLRHYYQNTDIMEMY